MILHWKRIGDHHLPVPSRAHTGDAGIDLPVIVNAREPYPRPHESGAEHRIYATKDRLIVFRTGWSVAIQHGFGGLIVVRSSIGKAGWDLDPIGGAGWVEHGQRMAQMLILPAPRVECVEVESLGATNRGESGFGSTGA